MVLIFTIWGCWVVFNTLLFFRGCAFTKQPHVTGLWVWESIHIPPEIGELLNEDELRAILAHEEGHIVNRHILENYLIAVFAPFLIPFRKQRRIEQEHEADDYAATIVRPDHLINALRKLSSSPLDRARADRIEERYYGA